MTRVALLLAAAFAGCASGGGAAGSEAAHVLFLVRPGCATVVARTLAGDPEQGALYVAEEDVALIGFAVMDWKWASTAGARVGHLEDLFVSEDARGKGVADALIVRCAERCRELGIKRLGWITATDNHRAQKVYDRSGATPTTWLEYELDV